MWVKDRKPVWKLYSGGDTMYQKKTNGLRLLLSVLALVLVFCCSVAGTLAWLTAKTDPVVNTFTIGDINIELWEPKYDQATNKLDRNTKVKSNTYKIVPGSVLLKDPYIEMKAGSEPCWLFIKMEKKNFINGISYGDIYDKWTALPGETDVFYREYTPEKSPEYFDTNGVTTQNSIPFFAVPEITISGEITKEDLQAIDGTVELNFTAYAIQYSGFDTVEAAWKEVNSTYHVTTPAESTE